MPRKNHHKHTKHKFKHASLPIFSIHFASHKQPKRFYRKLILSFLTYPTANSFHVTKLQSTKNSGLHVLTLGGQPDPQGVQLFNLNNLQEQKLTNIKIENEIGAAVFFNETLVICGGEVQGLPSDCTRYDRNFEVLDFPNLPFYLEYFTLTVYRDTLMVTGGKWWDIERQRSVRSGNVYKLDLANSQWQTFSKLNTARSSHNCQSIFPDNLVFVDITQERRQDVYCFGGIESNGKPSNKLEILIFETAKSEGWTAGTEMSLARAHFASTSFRGKIYVTGGKSTDGEVLVSVDVFDVGQGGWFLMEGLMKSKRYYHSCFYADGFLYLRGGISKTRIKDWEKHAEEEEKAKTTIEFVGVDMYTGELKEKFSDYHTSYEDKYRHFSVIVPKNFVELKKVGQTRTSAVVAIDYKQEHATKNESASASDLANLVKSGLNKTEEDTKPIVKSKNYLQELLRISKYVGEATVEPPQAASSASLKSTDSNFDEDSFITDMPKTVTEGITGTEENEQDLKTEIVREGEQLNGTERVFANLNSVENVTSIVAMAGVEQLKFEFLVVFGMFCWYFVLMV